MIYDKIMKFGYHDTDVTGISYDTTYYYRVTSGDMGSNEISVFIPAPVPMISVASLDGDLNFSTEPA